MSEQIQTAEAIANYGVLTIIAAVFLVAAVLLVVHLFKSDKARTERENKRYDQLIELTRLTSGLAADSTTALNNSTRVIEALEQVVSEVNKSVEGTHKVLTEVCEDLKEQRRMTDKMFTELRVMSAKKGDS